MLEAIYIEAIDIGLPELSFHNSPNILNDKTCSFLFTFFSFIQFPSSFTTQCVFTAPSLSLALCISLSKSSLSSSLVLMLSSSCCLRSCTAVSSSCRAWRRWALQNTRRVRFNHQIIKLIFSFLRFF